MAGEREALERLLASVANYRHMRDTYGDGDAITTRAMVELRRSEDHARLVIMVAQRGAMSGAWEGGRTQCACGQRTLPESVDHFRGVTHKPTRCAPTCADFSPQGFAGRWRDWHRGHGCDLDDGKPRTAEGKAEIAALAPPAPAGAGEAEAVCDDESDEARCGWTGTLAELRRDTDGVTHCPACGSTAIVERPAPTADAQHEPGAACAECGGTQRVTYPNPPGVEYACPSCVEPPGPAREPAGEPR